jgi:hypothetical protein
VANIPLDNLESSLSFGEASMVLSPSGEDGVLQLPTVPIQIDCTLPSVDTR